MIFLKRQTLSNISRKIVSGIIVVYQWTLSPDHGVLSLYTTGVCRFSPTCSEYTKKMVKQHGVIKGLKKGLKQIKDCH